MTLERAPGGLEGWTRENVPMISRTLEGLDPPIAGRPTGTAAAWPTAPIQQVAERAERAVAEHPVLSDLGIAVTVAVAAIVGLWSQDRLDERELAFTVALCVPLLLRRRQPMLVFAGLALVAGVQWLIADPQLGDAALLVALYGIALRGSLVELALAGVVMEAGAVMAAAKWAPSDPVKIWIGLSGLVMAAAVFGISIRQRRALLASLHERAARLEIERDQEGRLAAAAERNRIAREMHDIVAHNLSVMIALADGASYAIGTSLERTAQATNQISATGRDALLEMRRLLGILGDEQSLHSLSPQPGLGDLERLIERVRAAGVPVELAIDGDPQSLPKGIQLAVFRVAQEALTNTLKHATRPTEVRLSLRCGPDYVEFEATDAGPRSREAPGDGRGLRGMGRGLRGMRERALAYGGELQAGPRAQGGWRVHMHLRPNQDRRRAPGFQDRR
jgi:signal transduction histidine kinase